MPIRRRCRPRRRGGTKRLGRSAPPSGRARRGRRGRLLGEVERAKASIEAETGAANDSSLALLHRVAALPNLPADDAPDGVDETANVEIRRWGEPRPSAGTKDHVALGEALGLMDFEAAARIAGARFVVLKGDLARLERALGAFMLDMHTREHGYTEVSPPLLVREASLFGTGQLPKFAEEAFRTTDDRWLIPTSEAPLVNLVRETIVAEAELPLRYTALTPCFRSEAGASGRDTRGMIRQHQFAKVELVAITTPEASAAGARAAHGRGRGGPQAPGAAVPHRFRSAPAISASPRARPTIWRSGCPRSEPTGRSAPAPTAATSRRDGWRRAAAPGGGDRPVSSTP